MAVRHIFHKDTLSELFRNIHDFGRFFFVSFLKIFFWTFQLHKDKCNCKNKKKIQTILFWIMVRLGPVFCLASHGPFGLILCGDFRANFCTSAQFSASILPWLASLRLRIGTVPAKMAKMPKNDQKNPIRFLLFRCCWGIHRDLTGASIQNWYKANQRIYWVDY